MVHRLRNLRVVVIDDNPEDQDEVKRLLRENPSRRFTVFQAESGAAGIRAVLEGKNGLPDCVVLDYTLPDMIAPEVLAALADADGLQRCAVVVLTGNGSPDAGRRVLRAGAHDYLAKASMQSLPLALAIDNAIERCALRRELQQQQAAAVERSHRDAFFLALSGTLRNAHDPQTVKAEASRRLGLHLNASRVVYCELHSGHQIVIQHGYADGVPSIDGNHELDDYGLRPYEGVATGRTVVVADIANDPAYSADQKRDCAGLGMAAVLSVQLRRGAAVVAILAVYQDRARHWTAGEVSLVEEAAERTEHAMHRTQSVALLRQSEERLQLALRAGGMGVARWTPSSDALEMDEVLAAVVGLGTDDPARTSVSHFLSCIDPQDLQKVEADVQGVMRNGGQYRHEYRFRRPDGSTVWMAGHAMAVDAEGLSVRHLIGIHFNITDKKRDEATLRDADRRKDEFLATLAHELRNPLAPIRNGLEILGHDIGPQQAAKTVAMMGRQFAQLVNLVDDLLDLSRVNLDKIELRLQRLRVVDVIDAAIEACQVSIEDKRHSLSVEAPDGQMCIDADHTRMIQILVNLLSNAVKYTDPGGAIGLSAVRDGNWVLIRVTDDGVGIEADVLPTVWSLFTQVRDTLDKAQGGLGIGLSLVRRLVEMHHGSVGAASSGLGRGSSFCVRLPLAQATVDGEPREAATAAGAPLQDTVW